MSKLFLLVMAVSLSTALGDDKTNKSAATAKSADTPLMMSFTDLTWTELPERKGMQFAVLSGDPKTERTRRSGRFLPELTTHFTRIAVNSRM